MSGLMFYCISDNCPVKQTLSMWHKLSSSCLLGTYFTAQLLLATAASTTSRSLGHKGKPS